MGNVSAKSRISLAQFDRWADIYTGKSGANNQPKTIVRLNKTQDKLIYVVKDKVYHALGRSEDARRANDQVRQMFLDAIRDAFDGGPIPKSVMKVYNKSFFFSSRGCPLTARRIKAVVAAVKEAGGTLVEPAAPEPKKVDALRNIKRFFLLCDLRQRLFFFDFPGLDERLLFLLNLLIQLLCSAFFGALFHQLPLYGKLQDAVFQFLRGHSSAPPSLAVISASTRSISAFSDARSS